VPDHPGGALRLLTVLRDVGYVSFGRYGQYLVTAVTVPLTARVLGADGLGLLAIGTSAYFIGTLLVDQGIPQFLAARLPHEDVARLRGNYLAVRGAVFALLAAALPIGLALGAGPHLRMVLLGLFAGGLYSMTEDWVLVGQGRFGISTAYQAAGRLVYLGLLVLLLPRHPQPEVVLLCLAASSVLTVALTWYDAARRFGAPARPRGVRATVRLGLPVLTSRLLVATYGQGSATIYSGLLDAASLGLFSAGDRVVRALQALLDPVGYALLPRLARLRDDGRFWRRTTTALLALVAVAAVAAVALWVAAPLIVHVVYGDGFAGAVGLLRVEAFILPATALTSYVTTAVLPVRGDTSGVLVGAVIGTCVAGVWLALAVRTRSVQTLVHGTLCAEVVVALWYAYRVRWLHVRERGRPPAAAGPQPVPGRAAP
jgi:O-antigen/teichoic acid export membrane protein